MSFLVFERLQDDQGRTVLRNNGASFSLAGDNLLFKAWKKRGKPLDQGWHVSANELIEIHSSGTATPDTMRLVSDINPNISNSIFLVELLDIYAYTWGYGTDKAVWTPFMLRLRQILYEEYDDEIIEKEKIFQEVPEPTDSAEYVEFLYLQGDNNSWKFGPSGRTNAALIGGEAREYFRQFF